MNAINRYQLGNSLRNQGKLKEAAIEYRHHLQLEPRGAAVWNDLGNCLVVLGELDEAAMAFKQAIVYEPNSAQVRANLAKCVAESGDIEAAIELYRAAVELDLSDPKIHGSLLYTLYFAPGMTKSQLVEEHRAWAERHAEALKANWRRHDNLPDPKRRLRVGFVSPDFTTHPVGRFMLPLFVEHDREKFEFFAYSAVKSPDGLTDRFKKYGDVWREIGGMNDGVIADLIRGDGIDLLLDLSMHMGHHLGIFARKPAPIQITYLAYAGTTGLDAMDFRITDEYLEGRGEAGLENGVSEGEFVEKPLFVPSYWCYKPSVWDIEPAPPPSEKSGYVTFGCLNSFKKVSPGMRRAWAELLHAVPESRLIVHAPEGRHRSELLEYLGGQGVSAHRVIFKSVLAFAEYCRAYGQMDIALDTFPYSGGTTTCDALWMGVPVVTLAGKLAVCRMGVSILSTVGLGELICESPEEYVRMATALARDASRLRGLHAGIRGMMMKSRLMDARDLARNMEAAYRKSWEEWCGDGG